jgi:hypothetical protein
MGVGGVTAMGRSIGQGVSGVSTLSATSLQRVRDDRGAVAGLKYQAWRLEHAGRRPALGPPSSGGWEWPYVCG